MPFIDTNVSKSSQFWLDSPPSRTRLAEGNTLNVYSGATRDASKIILDVFGDMDCFTIFAAGFTLPNNDALYPLNVEWILVPSITCVFDTDMPLASAITTFTSRNDIRAGLLLRMSGFRMNRAVLYARIITATPLPYIPVQLYAVGDLRGAHRTNIEVGSVIG